MYSTRRMLERGRREANTLVRVAVLLKFAECRLGSGCQAKDPGWHRGSAAIPCAAGIPATPCPLHSRRRRYGLGNGGGRSEEHTSELQSLMRISYAVFCLKKKKTLHKQQ